MFELFKNKYERNPVQFLICLAFNLGIVARRAYSQGELTVEAPLVLRGLNELSHRVLSRALNLSCNSEVQDFIEFERALIDLAVYYNCTNDLEMAVDFACDFEGSKP